MIFQHFQKGVPNLTDAEAQDIMESGLQCGWWRAVPHLPFREVRERLTEDVLYQHLDRYSSTYAPTGKVFSEETPFISLTAGTRIRTTRPRGRGRNLLFSAHWTALRYATDVYRLGVGHIVYGYAMVLENPSIELMEFAEDVRDINVFRRFRAYHRQGEVTAKIVVPSVRIERVARWERAGGNRYVRAAEWTNLHYRPPDDYVNVRRAL